MKVKCPKCGKEEGEFAFFGEADNSGNISMVQHFVGYEIVKGIFGEERVKKYERCFLNLDETKKIVELVEYHPGHFEILNRDDYVKLGVVSGKLGMQTQYVAYYVWGLGSYPDLSGGLRILDDIYNYHMIKIHKDDVDCLVERIREVREEK